MALWANFVGSTYQALSPTVAAETAVNVFAETRAVPGSPKQTTFYGVPGYTSEATVGTSGCRGWFTQDGRTWVVVGDTLYERESGTYTSRGTIADDERPVFFASNGKGGDQLGIVGGGHVYVLDLNTNALTTAVLPFSDPVMIAFLDGYGLVNQAGTPIIWFSALEDLTLWDALDFFARSETSDNLVGIAVTRSRVWGFGSKTTTLFYNSGDTDTPFVPYPGTTMQTGLVSPYALQVYADNLCWVSTSQGGTPKVMTASDAASQPISTPPIELFLQNCTTTATARSVMYAIEGHVFFVMTLPDSPDDRKSYAFDLTERLWHSPAGWNAATGRYTAWPVSAMVVSGTQVLAGFSDSGILAVVSLTTYTNNGDTIRRERTAPYLSTDNQWVFVDEFELGTQPGVGLATGQGSAPVVNLEISRDGARTWTNAGTATLGATGQYTARSLWRRLGRFRADRMVFRVTQTDPVKTVWTGAWLRVTPGSGAL